MKVFITITQELNEYSIYKVSDDKVEKFRERFQEKIVIEGQNIADVIMQFDQLTKEAAFTFNPELKRYKECIKLDTMVGEEKQRQSRIKIK